MSDTQEFSYYPSTVSLERDREEERYSSRSDIEVVDGAFKDAKSKLYFKDQDTIDETLAVVGPQEHLGILSAPIISVLINALLC